MHKNFVILRTPIARFSVAVVVTLAVGVIAHASDSASLNGQWVGKSVLDGRTLADNTVLNLGDSDAANSSLRIEGSSTCTLEDGSYAAAGGAASYSLAFKQAVGNDACARLAKGSFSVHAGSRPRTLDFDVTYPGSDGNQNRRHGILSRYP